MNREDKATTWEKGWDGHHEEQLRRLARLPLTEKLKWLEEADRVVRHLSGVTATDRPIPKDASSAEKSLSR